MDNKADTSESQPIVHGDAEGGYIVEHHDGDQHLVHGVTGVDTPDAAVASAKDKWAQDAKEKADKADAEDQTHAGAKGVTKAHLQDELDATKQHFESQFDSLTSGFQSKIKEIEARSASELAALRDKVETHGRQLEKLAGQAMKDAGAKLTDEKAPASSDK